MMGCYMKYHVTCVDLYDTCSAMCNSKIHRRYNSGLCVKRYALQEQRSRYEIHTGCGEKGKVTWIGMVKYKTSELGKWQYLAHLG